MTVADYRALVSLMLDGSALRSMSSGAKPFGEPARLVRLLAEMLPRSETRRLIEAVELERVERSSARAATS
jgi:hypothetical protein